MNISITSAVSGEKRTGPVWLSDSTATSWSPAMTG